MLFPSGLCQVGSGVGMRGKKPGQSHQEAATLTWALAESKRLAQHCQDPPRPGKAKPPNRKKTHWGEPSFSATLPLVSVSPAAITGCRGLGGLNNRHFIFSQGWRFKVQDQGADRFDFWWGLCSFPAADGHLSLCPHTAFPQCVWGLGLFLLSGDTSPSGVGPRVVV